MTYAFSAAAAQEAVCGKVTPRTDNEALQSPEWNTHWKEALDTEVRALEKLGTWELVPREEMINSGKKPKGMKTVYKYKVTENGDIDREKVRIVAQGFSLIPGLEYHESYSSVLSQSNLRLMLYLAAQTGEKLSSADIGNAYLEAALDPEEVVYLEQHLVS